MYRRRTKTWWSLALSVPTLAVWSSFALAGNATIAISLPAKNDPFFQSLMGSSELKKADIALSPLIGSQEDSLTKVLVGAADLALVDLDTLKSRKFDGAPLQAFLFSIPFGFGGIDQAYVVQDAALGSAALSDISRTGLVALSYWNKGKSQLVTKEKLFSADTIKQLKIVSYNHDDATSVFTKLGASLRPEANLGDWESGTVNAAIVDRPDEKFFRQLGATYIVPIRPLVGVLVANARYWRQLNETQKRAWQRTVSSADKTARLDVQTQAKNIKSWATVEQIPLPSGKAKAEILSTGWPNSTYISDQLDRINETLDANWTIVRERQKKN